MIFSESLNLVLPSLVWWCICMNQIVFQKDWFAVFKVKVTVTDNTIKIWLFNILSELLIHLQVNLVWWHIIIRLIVLWKDWNALLRSRSRSQKRFRIPVNVHLNNIFSAAESSVTKHGLNYHTKDWFAVFKFRVTVMAHLIRCDCFYHICWTADLFATKFNWMVHHHKLECFKGRERIKETERECVCVL